ncbi:MAG: Crp/Fnr family transcriptional regulator [Bacteroidetes bacterium]|nr:Crp/Fnr family transcriptional regulator [Bacteroidota bacterium]
MTWEHTHFSISVDILLNSVCEHIILTEEDKDFFVSLLEPKKIKRKELLVFEGEITQQQYYILKGCFRAYQIDKDGVERVSYLAIEGQWISGLHSFLSQNPSQIFVEALENSELLGISKINLELLYTTVPSFEKFFRLFYQNALLAAMERVSQSISLNAEQRYLNFIQTRPDLEQRIPQKHIASYLGITPEFLSMLRSRMVKRKA